jgi:hypothetical protein
VASREREIKKEREQEKERYQGVGWGNYDKIYPSNTPVTNFFQLGPYLLMANSATNSSMD